MIEDIDYSGLSDQEALCVKERLSEDGYFYGYIPGNSLHFILNNYRLLSSLGVLEENWMDTYTHLSVLNDIPLSRLKDVFDACDKNRLQEKYPIYVGDHFCNGERFSLFRGCAGPDHRKGMSWTSSLDKAIWYAAHHSEYYNIKNVAVYAAVVERSEIYCCGDHYDYDFIVMPDEWWKIDVPIGEFRLNRPR